MDSNIIKIHSNNTFSKIALQTMIDEIDFIYDNGSTVDIYCFCHKKIINRDIINIDINPGSRHIIIGHDNILNCFYSSDEERDYLLIDILLQTEDIKTKLIDFLCQEVPNPSYEFRPTFTLTEKELSIIKHIAKGLTPPEIARVKNISIKTISTHKRNAMRKMNARTTQIMLVKYKIYQKSIIKRLAIELSA